ncbi:sugar phosphate isomerase/epimerase family protein [Thermogutta sp.]|uniref:sugar phosphate isomerase/epimerase family protein n=1 Tax=Thermogutta sp. TaxID=1962930 RepID=UPI003C7B8FD7
MNTRTRREWLAHSGVTLASIGLSGFVTALAEDSTHQGEAQGEQKKARRRRFRAALSCSAIGVQADQIQTLEYAVKYGFEAIEPQPEFLARLSDAELGKLREKMQLHHVGWSAAGVPVDFRGSIERFTATLRGLPKYCEVLQRAGVDRLGTYLSPTSRDKTYLENFRLHAKRLRAIADIVACYGMRLGLEYVGPKKSWSAGRYPFIHTLQEMKELIAEIDHPCVGFTLDSWHWYTAGETREDILSLRGNQVIVVHLNDAPAGVPVDEQVDSVRDLPCATGVIDLKNFLSALVEIGFDGPAYIEPFKRELRQLPPEDAVRVTAEAMRKTLALIE